MLIREQKRQGRFDAAAKLYRSALTRLESALSPRHPNLIQCRKNYAALLKTRKMKELAFTGRLRSIAA
jgi:hypothetical protein